MEKQLKNIDLQYSGFLNTPFLWENASIYNLKQFQLPKQDFTVFEGDIIENLRLGKRVERFVTHELNANASIEILAENIQIQQQQLTLGELDCILKYNGEPIHLEVVYKFYLYDDTVGTTAIDHWIGPNRKDSFVQKLSKLKEKQLPLLYTKECQPLLERLNLKAESIAQHVYFKAQLFVPLHLKTKTFESINNDCIRGFYIHKTELQQFAACKFYIPSKINWLIEVQTQCHWLTFEQFLPEVETVLQNKTAPLCWIKYPNGETEKCFVIWW
jgi:hypothetical protein